MKPYAVEYAMMKWVGANAAGLPVLAAQQPGLKRFVEPVLELQRRFTDEKFDVEQLNREVGQFGIHHTVSKALTTGVSDLVRALHNWQATLEEQGHTALLATAGLGLPGLSYIRKDIYDQEMGGNEWVEYRDAEVAFSWHDDDWTVRRRRYGPHYMVRCAKEPAVLETATLREQLEWIRSALTECFSGIDALMDEPVRWETLAVAEANPKGDAEQLAARFLSTVSPEERALLRSHADAFYARFKVLLKI